MLATWTLLCLVAVGSLDDPELPKNAIARVNGALVTKDDYAAWLVQVHGWRFIDDYLGLTVLRQEAAKQGVDVGPQDLEAAFAEDWRLNVRTRFGGHEEKFLAELAQGGIDRAGYRLRRLPALEADLLAQRLLAATRASDERTLRQLHEIEFGKEAVRTHIELAFFDKFKDLDAAAAQRKPDLLLELEQKAVQRAERFLEQARGAGAGAGADADFASLVRAQSDPIYVPRVDGFVDDLRDNGGDLPRYRKSLFGGALEPALAAAAKSGDLLGPVVTPNGCYVVRFLLREPAPFDAVRGELERIDRARPATPREIHEFKAALLKAAKIDRP